MLWSQKVLWDTRKGVVHVNWVFLNISNTPSIAQTKIIEPMLFIDYPKQGIAFLVGLGNIAPRWSSKDFLYTLKEVLHTH
jgi:hypothetical protein